MSERAETANRFTGRLIETPTEALRDSHPTARAAGAVTAEINPEPTRAAVDAPLALPAEQAPPLLDRCA